MKGSVPMPKIDVTPELAEALRTLRVENKVSARALADHLSKSPSYISKLEKVAIKSIAREELDKIIQFITADKSSFFDQIAEFFKICSFRFDLEKVNAQVWYSNYSTVYCQIPIPMELVDEINTLLSENKISREELCRRINSNELLRNEDGEFRCNYEQYPKNEWFQRDPNVENSLELFLNMPIEKIAGILDKKVRTTSYVFLQAIVVYTLKIIDYSDQVYISDAKQKPLYQAAQVLLSNYKVYSMAEKYSHLNEPSKLNIHDQRSQMEIYNLTTRLKFISNYDVQYTNEIFSRFSKNLDWDESFILSLMALPFHNMGTISFAAKKELIRKIKALIDEVIEQPKEEHKYDRYEFE